MKKHSFRLVIAVLVLAFAFPALGSKDERETAPKKFSVVKEAWHTPYKSQGHTGMCWSYGTTSFLESEAKRLGKGEFELSQVFNAYYAYLEKAQRYARRHGGGVFGQGGLPHDVLYVIRKYGAVPLQDYTGLLPGVTAHDHREMFSLLKGLMRSVVKVGENGNLSSKWKDGSLQSPWFDDLQDILDNHLGAPPSSITYKGRSYTPKQFADEVLALPYGDYIEVTSYSYLPFYGTGEMELHDNWLHYKKYFNVKLDDFMRIIDHALGNGYSLVFDLHTTIDLYDSLKGYAELPDDLEKSIIDQDKRDSMLEDWSTSDQHLVHGVGLARDEKGKRFYIIKDSWGRDMGAYKDLQYLSENFVRAKGLFIMVHKDALPDDIGKKLGIK